MELTNEFRVALPPARAWEVLTDLERIAPCMPGAQLQEVEGDEYRGVVKIKVGPITAQYKGQATFLDRDADAQVAVLRAEGRETRGQGNAAATITATLTPDDDGTAVSIVTDLTITGRVAQFGRGVLADVSAKLLDQFVECLGETVLADAGGTDAGQDADEGAGEKPAASSEGKAAEPAAAPAPARSGDPAEPAVPPAPAATPPPPGERPGLRRIESAEPQPVDLLGAAGTPVAKRVGPLVAILAVMWLLRRMLRRSRG